MGWFGGDSTSGDTSGSGFASKKRSSTDFDLSENSSSGFGAANPGLGSSGGDVQQLIQMEQQKAAGLTLMNIIIGFVATLAFACVSGLISGAIGGAVFKRGAPESSQSNL